MKTLLIVDTQNYFVNLCNKSIIDKINNYLKDYNYDKYIYLTRAGSENCKQSFSKIIISDCSKNDIKVCVKRVKYSKIFSRNIDTLGTPLKNYLVSNYVDNIELCGINVNKTFELISAELKFLKIKSKTLSEITEEVKISTGKEFDKFNLEECIFKSIHGFYIFSSDYMEGFKTSLPTLLSFATLDWLLYSSKDLKALKDRVIYYYKFYKNNTFPDEFNRWMNFGCNFFRTSNDENCLFMCIPIAWYCKTIEEINEKLYLTVEFISNNEKSLIACKFLAYLIFFIKNNKWTLFKVKRKLIEMIKSELNIKNIEFEINNNKLLEYVVKSVNLLINYPKINCLLEKLEQIDSDEKILKSLTITLAEAFYKKLPPEIFVKKRKQLPDKFRKSLIDYGKLKDEKTLNVKIS